MADHCQKRLDSRDGSRLTGDYDVELRGRSDIGPTKNRSCDVAESACAMTRSKIAGQSDGDRGEIYVDQSLRCIVE